MKLDLVAVTISFQKQAGWRGPWGPGVNKTTASGALTTSRPGQNATSILPGTAAAKNNPTTTVTVMATVQGPSPVTKSSTMEFETDWTYLLFQAQFGPRRSCQCQPLPLRFTRLFLFFI